MIKHYLLSESCQGPGIKVLLLFIQVGQGILRINTRWALDQITAYSTLNEQQKQYGVYCIVISIEAVHYNVKIKAKKV